MNKVCSRCSKTVYPLEELKCLDKIWHKTCFKCSDCGMTLNMRTYKGFNKMPYCEAHIPKPKATTVAETPELQRLAENTKIQSNVKYHAEFEKNKGKYTTVANDPETMRIKEASRIISNVSYHGDLQKKAEMESRRDLGKDEAESGSSANVAVVGDARPVASVPAKGPAGGRLAGGAMPSLGASKVGPPYQQQERGYPAPMDQNRGQKFAAPPQQRHQPQAAQAVAKPTVPNLGRCYRAIYDYTAADTDEVSFKDGDLIINCSPIDEGWMTGTVQRNMRTGMLPANYVEPAN